MKLLFRLPVFLFFSANVCAQNLVPNFSFEDTTHCPPAPAQIQDATGWISFGNTPDYLNSCASPSSDVSVPSSGFGWQQAYDGNGYIHLVTYGIGGFREFAGAHLVQPLVAGNKYYFSAWISRAYAPSGQITMASNNFCFRFSTIAWSQAVVDNFATYRCPQIISDTTNWTHVFGSFTADSAYQYLVLGNFFDDANTDTIMSGPGGVAGYFIDYVCVTTDSSTCSIPAGIENHSTNNYPEIYPNPSADGHFYFIQKEFLSAESVRTVDVLGREIPAQIISSAEKTEIILPYRGVFFLEAKTSSGLVVRKIMW